MMLFVCDRLHRNYTHILKRISIKLLCRHHTKDRSKTWITNFSHVADMDRRFCFHRSTCVVFFAFFLHCTQVTIHLKTVSRHVKDNMPKYGFSDMLCFVGDRLHPNYTHTSETKIIKLLWRCCTTDENITWIANITHFADMDRRF